MEPEARGAIVLVGLLFVLLFGGSAVAVIAKDGVDILTVISLIIAGLILLGVVAVIRDPPE